MTDTIEIRIGWNDPTMPRNDIEMRRWLTARGMDVTKTMEVGRDDQNLEWVYVGWPVNSDQASNYERIMSGPVEKPI